MYESYVITRQHPANAIVLREIADLGNQTINVWIAAFVLLRDLFIRSFGNRRPSAATPAAAGDGN